MAVLSLDRYQQQDSLIHYLDPRIKVVITLLFILSNVLLPDGAWAGWLLAWLLILVVRHLSRLPLGFVFKRSFIALPFALAAVTLLFTTPGTALWSWHSLSVTDAGLVRFTSILLRSWLSVQMAILLTATTRFPDLMHAPRHLRVPPILVSIIAFMYRYLFVLTDEAQRLLRARASRSAAPTTTGGGSTLLWRAQVAGNMIGQLLVRSLDRSDRVYQAMVARGYRGQLLTMNPHVLQKQDWLLGVAALAWLLLVQLAGWLL